jgi:hypothetical protein
VEPHRLHEAATAGLGARTSLRLDERAFAYLEDARTRSRMTHGKSTDRGKLVSRVLHGLAMAGFDLSEPVPEEVAVFVAGRMSSSAGEL